MGDSELEVGDTIYLIGTVQSRTVLGTDLPAGVMLANSDQRFDHYEVEILEEVSRMTNWRDNVQSQTFRVRTEDGTETKVRYRGRSHCGGNALSQSNSQGAQQSWNWTY